MIGRSQRRLATMAMAAAAVLSVAACSGSAGGDSASGDGLPEKVKIVATIPLTGPAAFAGLSAQKGHEMAVKEINEQAFLGEGTTLELTYEDTKGETQTAASSLSQAIADKSVSAVLGSVSSQDAVAQSPLAQKQGMPIMYTQAGSDGVVVGDYTYRATTMMPDYYPLLSKVIEENGWKSIGIIYTNIAPTLEQIGTDTIPTMAEDLGMTVTKSVATTATTQDYSAAIKQVLATDPDVVSILQIGASNVTAMTQLRQAGYTGKVLGNAGASAGNLTPAGPDGAGMIWAANFNYQQEIASSQEFVEAYNAEYDEDPLNYAAEAYDAVWFLAQSIKEADSSDRTAIKDGMATIADQPFDGAQGEGLIWEDGTIQTPGVAIEWNGTSEDLLYSAE